MGLFRRRERAGPDGVPDDAFPFFTQEQAARFRALARTTLAEHGVETTIRSDHLLAADGQVYGLGNLAARCHQADRGEREWPEIVANHTRTIVRAMSEPDPLDVCAPEEVLAHTYLRLMPDDFAPDRRSFSYVRDPAPGLAEVLALDRPDTVVLFTDEHVERFGLAALREAGLANLIAEPIGDHQVLAGMEGAPLHVVMGHSFFTASKALVLRDVLRQTVGDDDAPYGVLVCMPFRHQLAFHVVRDRAVLPAVQSMTTFAPSGYGDGAGPVSPFVYWWRDGEFRQLSHVDDGGGLRVEADEEFGAVLNAVMDVDGR